MDKITEREKAVVEGFLIGIVFSLIVAVAIAIVKYGTFIDG